MDSDVADIASRHVELLRSLGHPFSGSGGYK